MMLLNMLEKILEKMLFSEGVTVDEENKILSEVKKKKGSFSVVVVVKIRSRRFILT